MEVVRDIDLLIRKILDAFSKHDKNTAFTIAMSGIDGAGKGFVAKRLVEALEDKGLKVANVNIDPWQNPIAVRLQKENAAENVYQNIFRWEQFFGELIVPLQKNKRIFLETKGIQSYADIYYPLTYDYTDLDVLLIEGILLFKKKYLLLYDYKIWIDCSFEEGLQRAIKRNVEQLDYLRLIHDYDTFYYAAQRLHLERDNPVETADLIFDNNHSFPETYQGHDRCT